MIQQIQSTCDECNGTGEVIQAKDRCSNCKGKKVIPEKKLLEVHIDKGMKGGQTIYFRGESDQSAGAEPGDVVIVVDEKPHDRFRRQDNDLFTDIEIDLLTALGGGQYAIRHLDERALVVNFEPGVVVKHGVFLVTISGLDKSTLFEQVISKSFPDKACPHNGIMSQAIFMSRFPYDFRTLLIQKVYRY